MDESNAESDNPYRPTSANSSRGKPGSSIKAPLEIRVFAATLGLVLSAFAFGGYAVWSVFNFYSSTQSSQTLAVLFVAIALFLMACFCGLLAATGFKFIPRKMAHIALAYIVLLSIPACTIILLHF